MFQKINKLIASNLFVYSIGHALIDATTVGVVFATGILNNLAIEEIVMLVILYNVLAFALQAIIGFGVDYFKSPSTAATIGCVLAGISTISLSVPVLAVILAGIGNAFYHVGGGVISLNLKPGKATYPGIFVSTGAIGLLAGTIIGKSGNFESSIFVFLLTLLAIGIHSLESPKLFFKEINKTKLKRFEIIVILLLITITARAFIGTLLNFAWKSNFNLLLILTIAVVLGKASGGILGDKFGWIKVAMFGLILSAPLLFLGPEFAIAGILGAFLFNFTMPITLTALAETMPNNKGFAFGLTTFALIIGALPSFTFLKNFVNPDLLLIITLASAIILFKGLKIFKDDFS